MSKFRLDSIEMPDGNEFEIPVFIAEYGVTTYAELQAADAAGKIMVCNKNGVWFQFVGEDEGVFLFEWSDETTAYKCACGQAGWEYGTNPVIGRVGYETSTTTGYKILVGTEVGQNVFVSQIGFGSSTTQYLANNGTWQNIPTVPTKVSDLTNDSGFITTETDPTVPAWAKQSTKPSYTASEVGAIAAPSSPATGSFLVWDGLAWVAQTLSTWQGGNY